MRLTKAALVVVAGLMLSACSVHQDRDLAQRAVSRFHQELNRDQLTSICAEASEDLIRPENSQEGILHLLQSVRDRLGRIDATEQINWTVNYSLKGRRVTLVYRSQFDAGPATEQFVYRIRDDAAELVSYTIHSKLLALGESKPAYEI